MPSDGPADVAAQQAAVQGSEQLSISGTIKDAE
jgi:hypothetical protein